MELREAIRKLPTGLYRVGSRWVVKITGGGERYQLYYPDRRHGGWEPALKAARAEHRRLRRMFPARRYPATPRGSLKRVTHWQLLADGCKYPYDLWRAELWWDGSKYMCTRAVGRYGEAEAHLLAQAEHTRWRQRTTRGLPPY